MVKNKAQITLMMIIGIFLVIITALAFYAVYYYKNKNQIEPLIWDKASIQNYIDGCIKKTAEDGLRLLGKQGGYINVEEHSRTSFGVSNLLSNNKSKIPSIENMESELSFYIKNSLNGCLKDFKDFKKQGWNVEKGELNTSTRINHNDLTFEVNFPLKITDKEKTLEFDKFALTAEIRLKYIHELADNIIDFNIKNSGSVDRTGLAKYNTEIKVFSYNGLLIYAIDDPKSLITNQPFRFMFALSPT